MKDNEKRVEELVESFKNLRLYKLFLASKTSIVNSKELQELKYSIDKNKKLIHTLVDDKARLDEQIKITKDLEEKYDNHPLIVNYNIYRNELLELVRPLIFILEE